MSLATILQAPPPTTLPQPKTRQTPNPHGPTHKYQITHDLLYEREFHGEAYVSAHLQRLQHGVFSHTNVHTEDVMHVTFIAIAFTFHACDSEDHRFKGAVITIKTRGEGDGQPLRVLKFAPHLAFGKISSANMKWNFSLGASIGVTEGAPAEASVNASIAEEKRITVGAMMKIQGSTRSTQPTLTSRNRNPDTVIVWSLEENPQQEAGIPREFTFVFLVERSIPASSIIPDVLPEPEKILRTMSISGPTTTVNIIPESILSLPIESKPTTPPRKQSRFSLSRRSSRKSSSCSSKQEGKIVKTLKDQPPPSTISSGSNSKFPQFFRREAITATPAPAISKVPTLQAIVKEKHAQHKLANNTDGTLELSSTIVISTQDTETQLTNLDGIKDGLLHLSENLASFSQESVFRYTSSTPNTLTSFQKSIFTPIRLSVCIKPNIAGMAPDVHMRNIMSDFEEAVVDGMVGQKFPTALSEEDNCGETNGGGGGGGKKSDGKCWVNGLFNFASLPGSFEDMVELPGNAVSSVEPTLPPGSPPCSDS